MCAAIKAAAADGLDVIIDHHADDEEVGQQPNGLPYDTGGASDGTDGNGVPGTVSEAKFETDWQTVASDVAQYSNVIGFDLDNEPLAGAIPWKADSSYPYEDLSTIYASVGNKLQTIDRGALIIAELPIQSNDTYDATQVVQNPLVLTDPNKVVYSVHDYPNTIATGQPADSGTVAVAAANLGWGQLLTSGTGPVWVGEIGASLDTVGQEITQAETISGMTSTAALQDEQDWETMIVPYLNGQDGAEGGPTFTGDQQAVSTGWFYWGNGIPYGNRPDGTLSGNDGSGSINTAQQAMYQQLQLPTVNVFDTTTNKAIPALTTAYTGPVAGLADQFAIMTQDSINITTTAPNEFIEIGATGQTNPVTASINVSVANGNNVLDSYSNSTFYTDGSGTDQNYDDTRGATQNSWDTVVNFHSGDNITLWGITSTGYTPEWIGQNGASGHTGLTVVYVPTSGSGPEFGITLAGWSNAAETNVSTTFGSINGTPYASIHAT